MSEIKTGDLVQWEAGNSAKAGVVKKVNDDGTCVVSRRGKSGDETITVRTARLERITSTTQSEE